MTDETALAAPAPPPTSEPALPGDATRIQLPARVITYWRVQDALGTAFFLIVAIAIAVAVPDLPAWVRALIVAVPLIIGGLVIGMVVPVRYRIWWYAIGETQIDLQHGWLFVTRTVIPMTRVQHVELEVGPLASRFTLSSLKIHTAAGAVEIPALDQAEGERIRQQIAELASIADDL